MTTADCGIAGTEPFAKPNIFASRNQLPLPPSLFKLRRTGCFTYAMRDHARRAILQCNKAYCDAAKGVYLLLESFAEENEE